MDLFNNEIVGYDVRESGVLNHRETLIYMLNNKIKRGCENSDTIAHTNQGTVYFSVSFNKMFNSYKVTRFMSK